MGISMNLKVSNYTARVLGVIKEKYGLRNKDEALDRFAQMYGDEFADREVKEEVIRDVLRSVDQHVKKYGLKPMTFDELDKLCGV
ncbi:MAG: hypothetical protein AABX01_07220 [Candidatus Micrarchaeota archaeon]